jgi:hypothetical protein
MVAMEENKEQPELQDTVNNITVPEFQQEILHVRDQFSAVALRDFIVEGWKLHPNYGYIRDYAGGFYAFLYRVNAEIYDLEDFIEPEKTESDPVGIHTVFVEHGGEVPDGYVILHKDHVFSKGTVYTKQMGGKTK